MLREDLLIIQYSCSPGGFGVFVVNSDKLTSTLDVLKNGLKECVGSSVIIDIHEAREDECGIIKQGNLIETKRFEYKF